MIAFALTGKAHAADQDDRPITFDFEQISIARLATFLDQLTGKRHIVEGSGSHIVDWKYAERGLSKEEVDQMFIHVVERLGYKVSIEGDIIRMTAPGFAPPYTPKAVEQLKEEALP